MGGAEEAAAAEGADRNLTGPPPLTPNPEARLNLLNKATELCPTSFE